MGDFEEAVVLETFAEVDEGLLGRSRSRPMQQNINASLAETSLTFIAPRSPPLASRSQRYEASEIGP